MRHNGERRPEEIEADIARTRTDMDATLSAIEQRLTPGQLIDQGLDYLKHSGGREFASNLSGSVKNNPIPVALMGIGMAWLMATGNRKPSYLQESRTSYGSFPGGEGSSMTQKASESWSSTKDKLSDTKERLYGGVSSTRERFSQSAQSAKERMGQWGESARHRMERVRGSYDSIVQEQPLVLGLFGLAIGALIGAGLPRTRQEDQLMGEASDRLTEKAKEVGREQMEKAKEVASAAKDTVAKEAERQGLSKPSGASSASQPSGPSRPQSAPSGTQPAGKPLVVEPARQTPLDVKPKDPRLGTP